MADHKVLANETHSHQESNEGDRVALVVKDRATEWLQAYPAKSKSAEEVERAMTQFCGSEAFPKHLYTDNATELKAGGEKRSWCQDLCSRTSPLRGDRVHRDRDQKALPNGALTDERRPSCV